MVVVLGRGYWGRVVIGKGARARIFGQGLEIVGRQNFLAAIRAFQKGILLQLFFDQGRQFKIGHLQHFDCLLQLRRNCLCLLPA